MWNNERLVELEDRITQLEVDMRNRAWETRYTIYSRAPGTFDWKTVSMNSVLRAILTHLKLNVAVIDAEPEKVILVKEKSER